MILRLRILHLSLIIFPVSFEGSNIHIVVVFPQKPLMVLLNCCESPTKSARL